MNLSADEMLQCVRPGYKKACLDFKHDRTKQEFSGVNWSVCAAHAHWDVFSRDFFTPF